LSAGSIESLLVNILGGIESDSYASNNRIVKMTKPSTPKSSSEKRARKKRKFNDTDEEPEREDKSSGEEEDEQRDSWTKTFDPSSALHLVEPTIPMLSWDDYIAEDSVKTPLRKICSPESNNVDLLQEVKNKIQQAATGNEVTSDSASHTHHALLLYGPPGNGKTHAVRVMACQAAPREVYEVNLTSIKSTWCNQTENQLQRLLTHIATKKNAIVFVDEIDSFVGEQNRGDRHGGPLLTEFLRWLNGLSTDSSSNITLIFATNVKHLCSAAFLSRCSEQIEVRAPSQELRLKWWEANAKHLKSSEIKTLAAIEFGSFRDLTQLVDSVVLAESMRVVQRWGDGARYAGRIPPPAFDKYLQAATEKAKSLNKTESPKVSLGNSNAIGLGNSNAMFLDEVKTIAAATAASTFAALHAGAPVDQTNKKSGEENRCINRK
jgi:SpoVK/Ycf46/Vps4 family AAA+-type ATPase